MLALVAHRVFQEGLPQGLQGAFLAPLREMSILIEEGPKWTPRLPMRRSVWIAVRLLRNAHRVRIPGGPDDWVDDLFFCLGG